MAAPNLDEKFRNIDIEGKGLSKHDFSDNRLEALLKVHGNLVERIHVNSYAEADTYFTGDVAREVFVASDQEYYDGEASWYKYIPGLGAALLGIDFNYKES